MHVKEVNSKKVLVVNPEECGTVRRRRRKWGGRVLLKCM
jgi:hypothetical protein